MPRGRARKPPRPNGGGTGGEGDQAPTWARMASTTVSLEVEFTSSSRPSCAVEVRQGGRLLVVDVQTVGDGLLGLVVALHHLAAALVADALDLGRGGLDVVDGAAVHAGPPGGQAVEDDLAGHVQVDGGLELDAELRQQHLQGLGLGDGAREAVEQEAGLAVVLQEALAHDAHDQVVGDQIPGLHGGLGLLAKFGAFLDGGAQDVAGGDLHRTVDGGQLLGNGALTGAGGAQQDQSHREFLSRVWVGEGAWSRDGRRQPRIFPWGLRVRQGASLARVGAASPQGLWPALWIACVGCGFCLVRTMG